MTRDEKELLLKDISTRLPYDVICADIHADEKFINKWNVFAIDRTYGNEFIQVCISNCEKSYGYKTSIERIKPYLFPLSSMTKEQEMEYLNTCVSQNPLFWTLDTFKWLNKNHFDYNYLIDDDLAIDANGLDIY